MNANHGGDRPELRLPARIHSTGTGFITMFYTGSSMHPTLKEPDILHVVPLDEHPVRTGDVIVFQSAGSNSPVVHRVVRIDDHGIRTMGDNRTRYDRHVVDRADIIGRVDYVDRGSRRRRIFGGNLGLLFGIAARLRRLVLRGLSSMFRTTYRKLGQAGVVRRRLPARWRPRLVCFPRESGNEYQLILRGRVIGRLLPNENTWRIQPPFRLLVDEDALPRGSTDRGEA